MYNWFQNLKKEDNEKRLFHFRGAFGPSYDRKWLEYELCSGLECRFKFTIKPYRSAKLSIGLLFFAAYLTFPFFSFARWIKEKKTTGFYFHDWALVWAFMENEWGNGSSNRDPWWKRFYFHIDDFFLGKREALTDDLVDIENVAFKIGGKDFKMNSVSWHRKRSFRRFIPYALFHRTWLRVEMKIDKPPMRAGKGENSYDCDDDGSFGLYTNWPHEAPSYLTRDADAQKAIDIYVENIKQDAKRYGSGAGERGIKSSDVYEYVGPIRINDGSVQAMN